MTWYETVLKSLFESESPWATVVLVVLAIVLSPLLVSRFRVQLQNYFLKVIGADGNVGFRHAQSVYRLQIRESFSNLLGCYFDVERKLGLPNTLSPLEDDKVYDMVKRAVDDEFERVNKDIVSELTQWRYIGHPLKNYINDEWKSEMSHIKAELFARLVNGNNGGREYLRNKQEYFLADFAIWLKGVEENGTS